MKAAFAGSFDPPTIGHYDIISRASALFDELVVLVSPNSAKTGMFDAAQRKQWLEEMCRDLHNVTVALTPGLTVECARKHGAKVLVRSIRTASDIDHELNDAYVNSTLQHGMETVFLGAKPEYTYISSSNVRELIRYHQDISKMVCPCVFEDLEKKKQISL